MTRPTIQQQIDEVWCCLVSIKSAVSAWERSQERHRSVEACYRRTKIELLAA